MSADRSESLKVERQMPLQPLDGVDHEHAEEFEHQDGRRVLTPVHRLGRVDAAGSIEEALQRPEDAPEQVRFALEDAGHVRPEGGGEAQHGREEHDHFRPRVKVHGLT